MRWVLLVGWVSGIGCAKSYTDQSAITRTDDIDTVQCWKRILYKKLESLEPTAIIDLCLGRSKAKQWLNFMLDLNALFSDTIMNPKAAPPFILQSHLHLWCQQLATYIPTITSLEKVLDDQSSAVVTILRGGEGLWVEHIVVILETLSKASGEPAERLLQQVVGKLTKDRSTPSSAGEHADIPTEKSVGTSSYSQDNATSLTTANMVQCVKMLYKTTPEGLEACERIYDAKHGLVNIPGAEANSTPYQSIGAMNSSDVHHQQTLSSKEDIPDGIIEIMVAGWLQDEQMLDIDKAAIKAVASVLNLEIYECEVPNDKLEEATQYYAEQEARLIKEAERLRGIQGALWARDPRGTAFLLAQLGIETISPLDEEIGSLPVEIASAVEKHGENAVEISFPLASCTELQRSAMGIGFAKSLLVYLFVDYTGALPPSFCVHFDTDNHHNHTDHTPWTCLIDSNPPDHVYCSRIISRYTWQMSRLIHPYLKHIGPGVEELHGFVKERMQDLAHACVVCGQTHNARGNTQLRRSMPCTLGYCIRIWSSLPLDVRIPEIRADTFAVDMILTTVYAAAMSARTELLPGCPITNTASVQAILNTLPNLSTLRNVPRLSAHLKTYHKDAEKLIVWALTHFRGFLTTASGVCKIPGMPAGTHQFVLANASPILESNFAAKVPRYNAQTQVLFHGTSLDRLPSILALGLRIYSGTHLQRTGAAHGK